MSRGISFYGLLFIILLCLKVGVVETQVVGWPWWLITAPLWGPIAVVLSAYLVVLAGLIIIAIIGTAVGAVRRGPVGLPRRAGRTHHHRHH